MPFVYFSLVSCKKSHLIVSSSPFHRHSLFCCWQRRFGVFDDFDIETERSETVVATDHRAHGVLHPTVEEVTFALCQRLHERPHGLPRRRAQSFRTFAVNGDPLLSLPDVACVFNGVLILRYQVGIDRLANSCDANFIHVSKWHCM